MNVVWADFFLVLLVAVLTWAGYKRGVVAELFDVLAIVGSLTLSLRLYSPLGDFLLGNILSAFTETWAYGIAFFLLWVPSALAIFCLGLHLDRITKDHDRIPKPVREWCGVLAGFGKSVLLGCLLIGLFAQTSFVGKRDLVAFRTAPVVQIFRGIGPAFQPVVTVMAPPAMARRYALALEKNFPDLKR